MRKYLFISHSILDHISTSYRCQIRKLKVFAPKLYDSLTSGINNWPMKRAEQEFKTPEFAGYLHHRLVDGKSTSAEAGCFHRSCVDMNSQVVKIYR